MEVEGEQPAESSSQQWERGYCLDQMNMLYLNVALQCMNQGQYTIPYIVDLES